jgi:alkylation response protein AidB-like acyl-CoA dehydrogenase
MPLVFWDNAQTERHAVVGNYRPYQSVSSNMTDRPRAATLSLARILERIPSLTEKIKQGAAERDLSGELPYWAFKLVRQSGILALRVPTELDGPGGTITDVIETLATLAAGDSNVPHSLRTHFNFSESFLLDENSPQREEHARLLLAGVLFGGAGAEIGTPRPSNVTTSTLRKAPDGTYRLNGKKYYTTGTAFADIVLSSALTETGETVRISLPIDRLGIDVRNDWDGMGQRLTASGGVFFNDVEVKEGEFFPTVKSARSELLFRHASTLR